MNTRTIDSYFGELPFELTKGQKEFLRLFTTSTGHFALAGDAGSGKSTIMELLQLFYGSSIIFCASSGVANQQMPKGIGRGTAHKIMSLPIGISTDSDIRKVKRATQQMFAPSDLVKIVVVDEAFAMDSDHLYVMLRRIERFNKKSIKRKQRQIRLLLVGDPLQRLPICDYYRKKELTERYGHWLMFKSNLWDDYGFQGYVLDEVKRQSDKIYRACLEVFRYGQTERYPKALAWLNKRVNRNPDINNLLLAPTNKLVNAANNNILWSNPNPKGKYTASVWGKYDIKECPADQEITLAVGLDVITLVNDEEDRFANGSFGVIRSITPEGCEVYFPSQDTTHFVELYEFTEEESYVEVDVVQKDGSIADELKKRVIGGCTQVPIKQASAFTIARAQGRTFSGKGTINMGEPWLYTDKHLGDFGTADAFVALSRFTDINNVELSAPISPAHIKVSRESIDWWIKTLNEQKSKGD